MDRLSNSKGQMLSQIDLSSVPHSSFDRRNHNFLSCKLGKIVATRLDEVYPGDRIKGHIEAVANFEPLVSPTLSEMVMKQESFYVPYSIVWKNAHKFFTAKGGFHTPVPSVTPEDVWSAYNNNGLLPDYSVSLLNDILTTVISGDQTDYANLKIEIIDIFDSALEIIDTMSNRCGIYDLLQPIREKINSLILVPYVYDDPRVPVSETLVTKLDYLLWTLRGRFFDEADTKGKRYTRFSSNEFKEFCMSLFDVYYFIYETLFGLSSHLDYMGFPVNDHWYDFWMSSEQISETATPLDKVYSPYSLLVYSGIIPDTTPEAIDSRFYVDPQRLFSQISLSWLPFRAAYVIWYWNYRDELLETDALDPESDAFLSDYPSNDEIVLLTLLRVRCWYKDSFTTALTNTGSANLSVPTYDVNESLSFDYYNSDGIALDNTNDYQSALQAGASYVSITTAGGLSYKVPMNYFAPSFDITGSSLNSTSGGYLSLELFDRIHRLRTFLQKRLILGYEYDDMVWSSFMVKLSNVRMRIPELLARGRDVVQMNAVVNNTTTSEQIAGDKSAVAYAVGRTSDINYFAEEHGLFLSFLTIMPVQSYAGGLQRLYMKREQFDFMWPEFATMGMDAVYNFELSAPRSRYANYGLSDDVAMQVFGYQGRYYDLKSKLDECHGRLRSDLSYLVFSREFNMLELPKLNYVFVHCWPSHDMFVVDDDLTDVVRTIDVYNGLDFERRLPVPSEML